MLEIRLCVLDGIGEVFEMIEESPLHIDAERRFYGMARWSGHYDMMFPPDARRGPFNYFVGRKVILRNGYYDPPRMNGVISEVRMFNVGGITIMSVKIEVEN